MSEPQTVHPFLYPVAPHVRKHGPLGYSQSQRYKPWLRDEFQFRCVYCLCRERWCPDGEDTFSVEHYLPRVVAAESNCEYDNLLYACCRCNAAKRDLVGILNPMEVSLAEHLEITLTGQIMGLTERGRELIQICQLDRRNLTEFRRGVMQIVSQLGLIAEQARHFFLRRYFGFPTNLPRLSTLRPPGGNLRPNGLLSSYWALKERGELPACY